MRLRRSFVVIAVLMLLISIAVLLRYGSLVLLGWDMIFGPDRSIDPEDLAAIEDVPCDRCVAVYRKAIVQIPAVQLDELVMGLDSFGKKIVRVQAILHNDAGQLILEDSLSGGVVLSAGLADRQLSACRGVEKVLHKAAGLGNWYDGTARVVVLGQVGRVDDGFRPVHRGFNILCIEDAEPVVAEQ